MNRRSSDILVDLRRRAEAIVDAQRDKTALPNVPSAVATLLHELTVSQEELEIQNEELRQAQFALEESRDQFQQLFDLAPVAYFRVDPVGTVQLANRAAGRLLGCDPRELSGRLLSARISSASAQALIEQRRAAMSMRQSVTQEVAMTMAGEARHTIVTTVPIMGARGVSLLCAMVDITERKKAEVRLTELASQLEEANERLHELAMNDALTGTLNRRGFEVELTRERERARRSDEPLSVIMVDCDNFKRVNDSLGHATGDVVLRTVASRLKDGLRPTDSLARMGGDEFLALLPGVGTAQGMLIAERVRFNVCGTPVALSHGPVQLSVSVAVAPVNRETSSIEELLATCRKPLHESKARGKNRTSIAPEPSASGAEDGPRESLLDGLLMESFFATMAHSIVSVGDGSVVGFELLSRGPVGRYHLPADFFRIAVEEDLLTTVDVRCLKACVAAARGIEPGMWCHVNIYPSTLLELGASGLLELLRKHEPKGSFCVELSEQQMLGDLGEVRRVVKELRSHDVRIAIDDVGFGRSSLESLILLEPEVVKIDRKHVTGSSADLERRRALSRIVRAASALGATVIAEGVEHEDELAVLRDFGVGFAQGYFWGTPASLTSSGAASGPS